MLSMHNILCVIELCIFVGAVHQLEMEGLYTTSFLCFDGSYALISGANLTLQYDYRHNQLQVRMILSTNYVPK